MYSFIIENGLLYPNQSGFKQRDSCIYQLSSITHYTYQFLDQGYKDQILLAKHLTRSGIKV